MEKAMSWANVNMHLNFFFKDELKDEKSGKKRDELVRWHC